MRVYAYAYASVCMYMPMHVRRATVGGVMSMQSQAKAARRKMRNGYAHMGNSLKRPTIAGRKTRSVSESIARNRMLAAREAAAKKKK